EAQGVIGKESTPFLLARVAELTGGDSLKSNIQLVFNNAILASEIAKEYQRLAG
ncbi:pseudouridine-5'-phosphate glycosidase, partial [Escherichia coli]